MTDSEPTKDLRRFAQRKRSWVGGSRSLSFRAFCSGYRVGCSEDGMIDVRVLKRLIKTMYHMFRMAVFNFCFIKNRSVRIWTTQWNHFPSSFHLFSPFLSPFLLISIPSSPSFKSPPSSRCLFKIRGQTESNPSRTVSWIYLTWRRVGKGCEDCHHGRETSLTL